MTCCYRNIYLEIKKKKKYERILQAKQILHFLLRNLQMVHSTLIKMYTGPDFNPGAFTHADTTMSSEIKTHLNQ